MQTTYQSVVLIEVISVSGTTFVLQNAQGILKLMKICQASVTASGGESIDAGRWGGTDG